MPKDNLFITSNALAELTKLLAANARPARYEFDVAAGTESNLPAPVIAPART